MEAIITEEQYNAIISRIDQLIERDDLSNNEGIELKLLADMVMAYEQKHYPIGVPTVAELIELSLEEKGMTQRELANNIGVSPSRVNDYIAGRSEPTLKIARLICSVLNISPAQMLRV